ncbi:unnamed protein product [Didymodactylos carnosus]|uniref:Uncharacterized protein n=1 Tax=Didymodactylos carnosus TaxID=1234261 RepID=A0A815B5S3_9BILA|nr:unnamed protein product [Didymodactylos carnosus]CAF4046150.1 unnamed protein product [Didymodactylos carnosus]
MGTVAASTVYGLNTVATLQIFYKITISNVVALFMIITSQTMGYGLAGVMRRYLVWPAAMIWPSTLPTCAFLRSLHESREEDLANNISKWKISRLRLFLYIFIFSFTWYWFPGYIFPIISSLSFICAMNPTNVVFSQITGVNGLGVGTVQLDWNSITAYLGSPIVVPLWAQLNILASFVLFCWIIIPAIYYTNTWGGKSFPIGSSNLYTSEGYLYNISCIADKNSRLNITAYNIYGAGRMSIMLAVAYGIYYTASVLWGLIGTTRQFLHNSVPYYNLFWFFPIGVFLPVIQWFFVKKFKAEWLRYVNVPIMCIVISNLLPAPAGNFPSWLFLGFVFNLFIKRYASVWWGRYAYVTSSAMDCGLAFSALIIVVLQNNGMSFPNWWGITGYYDGHLCPLSYANYSGVIPSYKTT